MLAVLGQFRIIVKSVRTHYQKVHREAVISGAQLWALSHIASTPGGSVGELARALAIHQSTASNLLRDLERRELVTREPARDQRLTRLFASKKGSTLLAKAPRPSIGILQSALSDLPPARLARLRRELAWLIQAMRVKSVGARSTPLSDM